MWGRAGWGLVLAGLGAVCGIVEVRAQEAEYDLLVSSRNTHSVKRFDGATGEYLGDLVPPGAGGLSTTQDILLSPDGDLLVSGRGNTAILSYDAHTGEFMGPFTSGYSLSEPTKATWGPDGNLYVSQWGDDRENVAVFDRSGVFLREATPPLADPMQHAWDADGNLLVVYWGSKDVRRYDGDGRLMDVFVSDDRLQGPVNLRWVGDGEQLEVFDWQSGGVYRFDARSGVFAGEFIASVANPEGWAVGPDGALYVAEWSANRIKRFDAETGALIDVFAEGGGLLAPNSLLFVERR